MALVKIGFRRCAAAVVRKVGEALRLPTLPLRVAAGQRGGVLELLGTPLRIPCVQLAGLAPTRCSSMNPYPVRIKPRGSWTMLVGLQIPQPQDVTRDLCVRVSPSPTALKCQKPSRRTQCLWRGQCQWQ